jgi:carboxylate-amine ligase
VGDFTIGVEEEFFLVDAGTGALRHDADRVLPRAQHGGDDVGPELQRWQVETATGVCATLAGVRAELTQLRAGLQRAAEPLGIEVLATSTYAAATPEDWAITPKPRYLRMAEQFGPLAHEQLVCGCHVHVGIADRELAVQVLNRARLWLAPLLALAANSPFWAGADTGYASYRTVVWSRWPTAGPPRTFADRAAYDELVARLLATGAVMDSGMLYFDLRPSAQFETLEFRTTDVGLTVDDAVLVAGLVRALARTAAEEALAGKPVPAVPAEVLAVAHWQAARWGLDGDLVDLRSGRPTPAADLVHSLLAHVRPALEAHGDLEEVNGLAAQVLARGSGAARQRAAYRRSGDLADVRALVRLAAGG